METQPTICPHLQPHWSMSPLSYNFFKIQLIIRTGVSRSTSWTIPSRGKSFLSSSQRPEQFWDQPSLLSTG